MTTDDETRAAWLNLLGSGTLEGPALHESLEHLHDAAEASHHAWGCTGAAGHTGDCNVPPGRAEDYAAEQADAIRLGTEA